MSRILRHLIQKYPLRPFHTEEVKHKDGTKYVVVDVSEVVVRGTVTNTRKRIIIGCIRVMLKLKCAPMLLLYEANQ